MGTTMMAVSGRRERGVTLVELMIAMLLGLVLVAGIIQVFIGNRTTYAFNEGLARIQEHARFALDHMAYTTRMAGYTGCISNIPIESILRGPADPFMQDIRNGLQGHEFVGTGPGNTYNANTAGNWAPPLPDELQGMVIPGSDVLVVRHISGNGVPLKAPFTNNSSQIFLTPPQGFLEGQIAVVTDCQKASILQITHVNNTTHNITHSSNNTFTPGNISPAHLSYEYGIGAELAVLEATAFYIGVNDAGGPSLFQLRLARQDNGLESAFTAEELVEAVETMQILYGMDDDNDGQVNNWAVASAGLDWESVIAVQISLLARAPEEYGTEVDTAEYAVGRMTFNPANDRRLRQVFSTTVGVRNRLP